MKFIHWFSKRINLSRHVPASTSTGVFIAIAGVALAVIIMELSLAIVAGFKSEIERKITGFDASITVLPPYDYNQESYSDEMRLTDTLAGIIADVIPSAIPVATYRRQAIMKTDSNFLAVECIAYDSSHDSSFEISNLTEGTYPNFNISPEADDSIVISSIMASQLGLKPSQRVYLYFFVDGAPKMRRAFVSGVYNSNFGEYDKSVLYTSLPLLQGLSSMPGQSTGVGLEGLGHLTHEQILQYSEKLQQRLIDEYRTDGIGEIYPVTNILEQGAVSFSWLDLLDTNVIVIFILMSCVAAFTLISSLFIIILDRVSTIGILRSLGVSRSTISNIFINIALRIVGTGLIIGNIFGIGIILIQSKFRLIPLNPEMYYLDSVPVQLSWITVVALNAAVIMFSWLILILPARLTSRIDPSSTMRYE